MVIGGIKNSGLYETLSGSSSLTPVLNAIAGISQDIYAKVAETMVGAKEILIGKTSLETMNLEAKDLNPPLDAKNLSNNAELSADAYEDLAKIQQTAEKQGYNNVVEIKRGSMRALVIYDDEGLKPVVVVIRGTELEQGAIVAGGNLGYDADLRDKEHSVDKAATVKAGLRNALHDVDSEGSLLEKITSEVSKIQEQTGATGVVLTGHSLGGGVAILAAEALDKAGFNVEGVVTIGAPPVGNKAFVDGYNKNLGEVTTSVQNVNDAVVKIANMVHENKSASYVGEVVQVTGDNNLIIADSTNNPETALADAYASSLSAHSVDEYVNSLNEIAASASYAKQIPDILVETVAIEGDKIQVISQTPAIDYAVENKLGHSATLDMQKAVAALDLDKIDMVGTTIGANSATPSFVQSINAAEKGGGERSV